MIANNIPFNSSKHENILKEIRARVRMAENDLSANYDAWREQEKQFTAYLPEREVDRIRRENMETKGEPELTTVVVPYNYSMLMTAHTYWSSVLLGRNPVLQYMGRHGESETNVLSVESLLDYQVQVGRMLGPLYIWLMDVGRFGLGVIGSYWDKETRYVSEFVKKQKVIGGVPVGEPETVRRVRELVGYEGNRVFNIRPYDYLPDTRVPLGQPQAGEFNGWRTRLGWSDILQRQRQGFYFNLEELRRIKEAGRSVTGLSHGVEGTQAQPGFHDTPRDTSTNPVGSTTDVGIVELVEMCVKVIPEEWGLGHSTHPEKWMFTIAEDKVVIGAQPLGLYSDQFPVDVLEYEIDGYRSVKRSLMEISRPLNEVMTWLFNSHMASIRENVNGNWIYDPMKVYTKDVLERKPGKRIRLRPEAMGADVRTAIHQLQTMDPTGGHLRDASVVGDMAQRVVGVMDTMMGVMPGGRNTATESRQAEAGSASRQRTLVEYFSATGFYSLAEKLLSNTQQLYQDEKYFRIVGDAFDPHRSQRIVRPEDIAGAYDYVLVDGTAPLDRYGMVTMWTQLLGQAQALPQVLERYDMGGIFSWIAQLAGLRNIKRFEIQQLSQGAIEQEVQAGNLVPQEAASGVLPQGIPLPPAPNQQRGGPQV